MTCPKQHDYTYVQHLKPKTTEVKGYFHKGNYTHELFHEYYKLIRAGVTPGSPVAISMISKRIESDVNRMLKHTDIKQAQALIPVYHGVSRMVLRFVGEQSPRIDRGIQIEGVEVELTHTIREGVELLGYADLVYRTREGQLRVRDHKTGQKAWTKLDATWSNQLLHYATVVHKNGGEVPVAEINYINSKEYKVKQPTFEEMFTTTSVVYTPEELEIYYVEICMMVEAMLKSPPIPHYNPRVCEYCVFKAPCLASRKGMNPAPIILTQFTKRDSGRRHDSFTDTYASGD